MQRKIKEKVKKAQIKAKVQKEQSKKVDKVNKRRLGDSYVFNYLNGEYWLSEYNLIALQLKGEHPRGNRDGSPKTDELLAAEAMLFKVRAEKAYKFAYRDLVDLHKMGLSDDDITNFLIDFRNRRIKREQYDLDENVNMSSKVTFG